MRKKIILSLIVIFLFGLGYGIYYLNSNFLPSFAREKIVQGLSELTEGKVTLEDLNLDLFRGVVISHLILYDKNNPDQKICHIKEMRINFLIIPFIKGGQIIIPSLTVDTAAIRLIRAKDNTFNLSYLVDKLKKPAKKQAFSVSINSIRFLNTSILFTDASFEKPLETAFMIEDLSAAMSWNKAYFKGSGEMICRNNRTSFHLQGAYSYAKELARVMILAEGLDTTAYKEYLRLLPLQVEGGLLSELKADCSVDKNNIIANATFTLNALSLKQKDFSLKNADLKGTASLQSPREDFSKALSQSKLSLDKADISMENPLKAGSAIENSSIDLDMNPKTIRFNSHLILSNAHAEKEALRANNLNAEIDAQGEIPLHSTGSPGSPLSYEGIARIKSGTVSGIPDINKISGIISTIKFKNNDLDIESTSAEILGSPVSAQGTLRSNILNMEAKGAFDLNKIAPLTPKEIQLPPYRVSGTGDLTLYIKYTIAQNKPPLFAGDILIKNLDLKLPENNLSIKANEGQVKFDTEGQTLQGHFNALTCFGKTFKLDANLKDFKIPHINLMIVSDEFKLHANFTKEEDKLSFSSFDGQYKNSSTKSSGTLDLKTDDIKLTGSFLINLKDVEKCPVEGVCLINAEISGPLKNYKLWSVKAKGQSKQLKGYGYKATDLLLDYNQIAGNSFINSLAFGAYGGSGVIKGRINLSGKDLAYTLFGNLDNIDLNKFKMDAPSLKDKTFFGILSLKIETEGKGTDLRSLKGSGTLTIKNGNVWEFNPLKGLGNFLFIPRFSNLVFTHAQGDFSIKDEFVSTNDLELTSTELGLLVEGKIGFSGTLNLLVNTQVPLAGQALEEIALKPVKTFSRAANLTAIKITGTVQEPKYELQPIGENIMKKLSDIFSSMTP